MYIKVYKRLELLLIGIMIDTASKNINLSRGSCGAAIDVVTPLNVAFATNCRTIAAKCRNCRLISQN
jgi:hypothetical protein